MARVGRGELMSNTGASGSCPTSTRPDALMASPSHSPRTRTRSSTSGRAFTDTNGMWHTAKPHTPPIPNAAPSTSTGGADIDTVLVDLVETHGPDSRRGVAASFLHSCLPTALAVAHDVNDIATRLGLLADTDRITRVGTGRYTATETDS